MGDLQWGIENGDLEEVKKLVESQQADVNDPFKNGRYPLHCAADYGQDEIVQYLLSKGAEVNVADKYGITPLLCAIYEEHASTIKLLLEHGAEKNKKSPDGNDYKNCTGNKDIQNLLTC